MLGGLGLRLERAAKLVTKRPESGAVPRTQYQKNLEIVSVQDFGAGPAESAATNTAAFNAAIAARSVIFVPGDTADVYDLNALADITAGKIIYGTGAKLRFNTAGVGINLNAAVTAQNKRVRIEGIAFGNITNTPAAYIKNTNFINTVLENLQFSNCAATYCIDNVNGYGLQVRSCVFSDVTGSGVRLRDDGGANVSYASKIRDCDFTQISVDGITTQGHNVLSIDDCVIEGCGGKGIVTATAGGASIQGWNLTCKNTWFEANTGDDISLGTDGGLYWSTAVLIGCVFNGTPSIALGAKSKITVIGCNEGGSNTCTVTGSANAEANLIQSTNFIQSGAFRWVDFSLGPTMTGMQWTTNVVTSTGLSINAGQAGRTYLIALSTQNNAGNGTASALYMIRCGYDANNFTATKISGDDGGAGAGASTFAFTQVAGVLQVQATFNGTHQMTVLGNR